MVDQGIQHTRHTRFLTGIVNPKAPRSISAGESVLTRYYPGIRRAQAHLQQQGATQKLAGWEPDRQLPELSDELARLFEPGVMEWHELGEYKGCRLRFLNLMLDPTTHTTKTFASLLMVARAIAHIRETEERIVPTCHFIRQQGHCHPKCRGAGGDHGAG